MSTETKTSKYITYQQVELPEELKQFAADAQYAQGFHFGIHGFTSILIQDWTDKSQPPLTTTNITKHTKRGYDDGIKAQELASVIIQTR